METTRLPKLTLLSWLGAHELLRNIQRRIHQANLKQVAGNLHFMTILSRMLALIQHN